MKVIGLFSIKGGVGKTAAAVNLAYIASRQYKRTLLWDLDPQAASSFYLRVKPKSRSSVGKLFERKESASSQIRQSEHPRLDIIPSDTSYRKLDLLLNDLSRPRRGLERVLNPLGGNYDFLFLDCPPSLNLLSENIFQTADVLLVPIIPTTLSVRTLEQLFSFFDQQGIDQTKILPFFSMVDRRKRLHVDTVKELPHQYDQILKVAIPYASIVEQMGERQAPLGSYAKWTEAAESYERLWRLVKRRLRESTD